MEGFWVQTSLKVNLTKAEKRQIGRPSSPRWELDVVAYSGRENTIYAVECKSYLDSRGVRLSAFNGENSDQANRYKLFNDPTLRTVVLDRLGLQLFESGACSTDVKIKLCLACGNIASEEDRKGLHKLFKEQNWELWDEHWIKSKLKTMSEQSYENQISAIVSKLLIR